jgi:hypothetical protein
MSKVLAIACITVLAISASAIAQQTGIKRTVIRTFDYPPGYTTITGIVELGAKYLLGPSYPSWDRQRLRHGGRLRPQDRREARTDVQGWRFIPDIAAGAP